MAPQQRYLLVLALNSLFWVASCAGIAGAEPQAERCVILVSIDGLAHFYLDDPQADLPTIRRLAGEGARADGVVTCFPSVTWPAHTTLATGASPATHGVIGNDYLDRGTRAKVTLLCDPVFDKDQVVKVPTIYDAAHRAGLRTAGILWPAARNARTLDWTVPDMPGDDAWQKLGTRSWLVELIAAGLPIDRHGPWCREPAGGVQRDWLYVRMARQVLQQHAPNLVLIHLVEPDHVQHRVGPRAAEAYWCASYADDRIRDLVEAVAGSSRADRTTIFVCSDHGFLPIRKTIQPNVALAKQGLIEVTDGKMTKQTAYCLSQGGAAAVYVLDDARREELVKQLQTALAELEGVAAVLEPDQFAQVGQARPEQDPRAPDLWLAAKADYSFGDACTGEVLIERPSVGGTHGYLPDQPDMLALCVVWGPGIKAGTNLGKIHTTDIAPTIARILGVDLPTAEGTALEALLTP